MGRGRGLRGEGRGEVVHGAQRGGQLKGCGRRCGLGVGVGRMSSGEERGAILCISEHKSKMYILYLLIGPVIGDIQASAWYQLSTTGSKRSSIDYALI
jgi:hypothetical protein